MKNALGSVQTVLVLGGTSEIAHATALELARRGARAFVLAGRDITGLGRNADAVAAAGAEKVFTRVFDAVETETHDAFVDDVRNLLGDVDFVLLAFGVLGDQGNLDSDREAALELIEVDYLGAVSILYPVTALMRAQGHGTICVLSSVAAERPRRSNYVYGSAKAGLDAYCLGLTDALAGTGVRVMVVRPGMVRTKMTAGLREAPCMVESDDVAQAIVAGLAADRELIWVPGAMRWVMTALRHLPRVIFRRLPI